ncbi:hypothetical protein F2P56_001008 [Juglans regia]|uniref:Protein FAR1-RELATED SEQUENCE n=2 Tax=Juglans regia TaxID=51240 RepID=A0A2I4E8V6_JUGRE|nr:protein FAR-RED IMPAIRED RESPONSE 1-like [Juglans regia]KAF5480245.1 hypothetical protein F2P56_001008 [Juglans regia]
MAKSFNALVIEVGGFEKLPFIENDARNYIDKARHLRLGKGGANALRGYFERMQYKNDEFYSSMDLDDDDRLKNIFWADARSRAAYDYFGDVICVYDSQTSDEFEKFWEVFINTYNLKENAWLQRTTLKEFVDQFDNALRKKVENEMAADFHSFNCTVPCITHLPVEKKFQAVYTNSKFKEVQSEVMEIIYSHCVVIKTEGAITTYQVNDQRVVEDGIKKSTLQAYFNEDECEAKCMCGLFEMREIICRHILSIFAARDVQVLPEKYIMERWWKDIKRRYALIRSSYDDLSGKPAASRYSGLIKLCFQVATYACESEDNSLDMT